MGRAVWWWLWRWCVVVVVWVVVVAVGEWWAGCMWHARVRQWCNHACQAALEYLVVGESHWGMGRTRENPGTNRALRDTGKTKAAEESKRRG